MKPLKVFYSQKGVYNWGNTGRELMSLGHPLLVVGEEGYAGGWGGLPCWTLLLNEKGTPT